MDAADIRAVPCPICSTDRLGKDCLHPTRQFHADRRDLASWVYVRHLLDRFPPQMLADALVAQTKREVS